MFQLIQSWTVYLTQSGSRKEPEKIKKKKKRSEDLSAFHFFYSSALLNQYKRDLISPLTLSNED